MGPACGRVERRVDGVAADAQPVRHRRDSPSVHATRGLVSRSERPQTRKKDHLSPALPETMRVDGVKAPQHLKTPRSHSSRSSAFSSSLSTLLYRTMSRCKFRTMIMATMTVRNNTINSEFTIENQCTLSGTCVEINR